jgi:hypothetical protein
MNFTLEASDDYAQGSQYKTQRGFMAEANDRGAMARALNSSSREALNKSTILAW